MAFVYGLIGLGIIVFIHETGHFLAARLCKVKVESFSIGMGPVIFHKTVKGTDYRLSLIPLGGYCGMKGEKAFQEALDANQSEITAPPDSFYGTHPLKRMFIAFCGPFANIIFAVFAYTLISIIGYNYYTTGNRIVLSTEMFPEKHSPAAEGGLKSGDTIISIDGQKINYFSDISSFAATHPDEDLSVCVERDGKEEIFKIHTDMDKSTGMGFIGITSWIDLEIKDVTKGSPAENAGIKPDDLITHIDGIKVNNTVELKKHLEGKETAVFTIIRNGSSFNSERTADKDNSFGFNFKYIEVKEGADSLIGALNSGIKETWENLTVSLKSIVLLFKGIDFSKAVSGPVRITKMLGDTAKQGFSAGVSIGFVSVLNFLAIISISLFIMNLLPIPVLDGGLILFALAEFIRRKQIHPKVIYYMQFAGIFLLVLLFGIALYGDLRFLVEK